MRMWNVDPEMLCRQHLLGEHCEMHMMVGTIERGKAIRGYVETGLMETGLIQQRHDDLVREMEKRNYNHRTPMLYEDKLGLGRVDVSASLRMLRERCGECAERQGLKW